MVDVFAAELLLPFPNLDNLFNAICQRVSQALHIL